MSSVRDATITGLNTYISEQRENNGTMKLTLINFNQCNQFDVRIEARDVREVSPLTAADYTTQCGTPLYDAMARTIDHAAAVAKGVKDVIVVVMTDGGENASREHTRASVFSKVERMKASGWSFVFLGANQDSFAAGGGIGVARRSTANYQSTNAGVATAWASISKAMTGSRSARAHLAKRAAPVSAAERSASFSF